jgi:hypothetical protein
MHGTSVTALRPIIRQSAGGASNNARDGKASIAFHVNVPAASQYLVRVLTP